MQLSLHSILCPGNQAMPAVPVVQYSRSNDGSGCLIYNLVAPHNHSRRVAAGMKAASAVLLVLVLFAPFVIASRGSHHSRPLRPTSIRRMLLNRGGYKTRFHRSAVARRAFMRQHPCPSTGKSYGACPGYIVDHIRPLKRGGPDTPGNMQWQTEEAAKAKDRIE
jgi:hypothetical protein